MSRKLLLGFLPSFILFTACLENLHEQKYFDTLERKNPALYATVMEHRAKIEEQLNNALRESLDREVREIGMWGARWDHVRKPVEGEYSLYERTDPAPPRAL